MKLTVLGMNGPYPAPGGATSGYLLENADTHIQLDLGTGTLSALSAIYPPEKLNAIVFSHWHSDHCSDMLPLLYLLQAKARKKMDIYGPEDPSSSIRKQLEKESCVQLHTIKPGDTATIGGLTLTVGNARHPVPAILEKWTDGKKVFIFTGDTNTVDGLTEFCSGADLLLADGLFPAAMWTESKPHLSSALCAELAKKANVKRLVITHMNPDLDAAAILAEAQAIRPDTLLAAPGMICSI